MTISETKSKGRARPRQPLRKLYPRLSKPTRSSYVTEEEIDLLLNVSKVWYKNILGRFYWLHYPRLDMEPERIKKGEKIYCEWDLDDKGIPQYYDATIVRKHKKNGVVITFDEEPAHKYCLTFRGAKDTATNRKRDMIFRHTRV